MTVMSTIVAVALGVAPVNADGTVQPISDKEAHIIGRYSEFIDDTGTTHLRGVNRMTGELFDLTVNPHGRVEGSVGAWIVRFQVASVS
jgi:hypothetical protein